MLQVVFGVALPRSDVAGYQCFGGSHSSIFRVEAA